MQKTKLIEIAEIIMGQSPESKFVSNEIIGLPLLNGPAEFTDKFPIPIQYTSESKRLSEKYDILFCVRGSTTGRMNIADQKYAIGRGLAAIRHRKGYKLNTYIKAQIEINLKKLLGGTLGSVFPNLTKENLYNLECFVHSIEDQRKIAKVLSDLDAKIELNNKINTELEAMAKTLYEYWFVQFDFPDANGKPYKTSGGKMVWNEELKREIPEGWEVKEMSDLCVNVQSGGTPNTSKQEYYKGNINWFSTQELNDTFNLDSLKNINELAVKESSTKLFPENTVLIAIYASPTVGRLGILSKQGTFNQACCGLVAKANIGKEYIFLTLLKNRKLLNVLATGTTQKNLGVSTIKSLNVIIPEDKTLDLFIKQVRPLFNKILNNLKENQQLASLRDWLLPMLMNGQVTVASTGSATEKGYEVEDSALGMVAEEKVEYKKS